MDLPKYATALRLAPSFDLEVKADAQGHIEGYASTFGGDPDRHGDVVQPGAFGRSLGEHKAQGTMPAMLWSHQLEAPIGRWTNVAEDSAGLFVAGQVNLKTDRGREAFEHIRAGDATGFSIGFITPEGGRRYLGKGAFALDEVDLVEISIVTAPANARARVRTVKHLSTKSEAVAFLRDAGLPKAAAARFAAGGFPALASGTLDTDRAMKFAAAIETATKRLKGH